MKIKHLTLVVGIGLLVIACKKEESTPPPTVDSSPTLADYEQYLVGNYSFNNTYADLSGSQANLTAVGASFISDRNGNANKAIFLDGNNSSIAIENTNDQLKLNFPFTVSLWTKITDSTTFNNRLFNSDSLLYYGYYIACGWPLGGEISAGIGNGNATPNLANNRVTAHSTSQLSTNQWYHVCAVFKGVNEIDIYINGIKETVTYDGAAQTMVHSSSSSFIGWQPAYSFNGSVDNVKIWNKALPAIVIAEEYNSQL